MFAPLTKPCASLCAVAVFAAVLIGCGGTTPDEGATVSRKASNQAAEILNALRAYYQAGLDRDGAASCALTSRRTRSFWSESAGGQSCPAALDELFTGFSAKAMAEQRQVIRELDLESVRVSGDTATVTVTGETADMVKEGGRWLVDNTHPANARELTRFSAAQLELELKERLDDRNSEPIHKVKCPLNQPVKPGYTFDCVVEDSSGSRAVVTIEVRSFSGDYRVSQPTDLSG